MTSKQALASEVRERRGALAHDAIGAMSTAHGSMLNKLSVLRDAAAELKADLLAETIGDALSSARDLLGGAVFEAALEDDPSVSLSALRMRGAVQSMIELSEFALAGATHDTSVLLHAKNDLRPLVRAKIAVSEARLKVANLKYQQAPEVLVEQARQSVKEAEERLSGEWAKWGR